MTSEPPPWYLKALQEQAESVRENGSHPRILEYLQSCSDLSQAELGCDATPWCSAFVNWCFEQSGIAGTGSSWARSWAEWGERLDEPRPGAVAVWARGRTSEDEPIVKGHVAFVVADEGDRLVVLGGNQSDCICTKAYPKRGYLTDTVEAGGPVRELYELLGYRWPVARDHDRR